MTTQKAKIFLGGPFSAAMTLKNGGVQFDPRLKLAIEHVLGSIEAQGAEALSSHVADKFGKEFDKNTFVIRDNLWAKECDLYVALLPLDNDGGPYRSDGTFVELGLALALQKNVLMVMEEPDSQEWSYYLQNLGTSSDRLKVIEWNDFMSNTPKILQEALSGHTWNHVRSQLTTDNRIQTTDAVSVLEALSGQTTIDIVNFRGLHLKVLPGVLSPKISHAPDYIIDNWRIPIGSNVLDLGCGSGVLGLFALHLGASKLVSVDNNPQACENTALNANGLGFADRITVLEGDAYEPIDNSQTFDVIILSPPYWNKPAHSPLEASCFDEDYRFLSASLLGARKHLNPEGSVFLVFSDQGDLARLTQLIQDSGLHVSRVLAQRPTMVGGHIRFFYEFK